MDERSPKRRRTSAAADVSGPSGAQQTTTPRSRRRRPSYASPTRASMMRHNPQIIERREAAASAAAAEASAAEQANNTTAASEQQTAPTRRLGRGGILAPPGQQQQQQQLSVARRETTARNTETQGETPRATERDSEEADSEFIPRTRRLEPVTGISFPPPPEPELPPTRPDPVSSSPSKGIHSSPSRWKVKAKKKSSPLKQPPMRPHDDGPQPVPTPHVLQRRQNPPAAASDEAHGEHRLADPARNISLQDPQKLKERNALREELGQLQRDLETARQENARLLRAQSTGQYVEPANKDEILDLLRRSLVPADPLALPPQSQQLMLAALNPIGLLPFSRPVAALAPERTDGNDLAKDIKSHHPVEMSAEEELPYLKLFTPFAVTSSVAALPATREHPFRQRRLLTLRSTEASSSPLLSARVELIVNPMTLAILELRLEALEPPTARAELRPFVAAICDEEEEEGEGYGGRRRRSNRSMQRNVGMLFWAMSEWHRTAVERAGVWAKLDEEILARGGAAAAAAAVALRRQRESQGDGGEEQADTLSRKGGLSPRGAYLRYLVGRQAYDIPIEDGVHIRLDWKIGFDWTGDAESKLTVLVGVPGKWRKMDNRGSLGKLGGLFQDLVRGGESIDLAARKVAALLADDGVA